MALNKAQLKTSLKAAMAARITNATPQQLAELDSLAGDWADAIDTFVKGAQVVYSAGLLDGNGSPVTGVITHTIS